MADAAKNESANPVEEKLPRRDWILLPTLSMMTILILVISTELIARYLFTLSERSLSDCLMLTADTKDVVGIPNCVFREKMPEAELTLYQFNSSGYRSNTEFGRKAPGTFRIVLVGSSFALGARVPVEDAFATRLAPELSQLTGKKIEILNMGMAGNAVHHPVTIRRFDDALAVQPDMILRIITPWDIAILSDNMPVDNKIALPADATQIEKQIIRFRNHHWRALIMVQHLLYQSQSRFVKTFLLKQGDALHDASFLNATPDAEWDQRLQQFDRTDASIEERVKTAGVPVVSVLIPMRAQAAMLSMGEWPDGYDPLKLDNELRSIVTRHDGTYIDILQDYRYIPNPEDGYFPVEGHLNIRGNETVTRLLAKALTSGSVPALNAITPKEPER